MTTILVSIALPFPDDLALGVYDLDTREFRWVELSALGGVISGVNGMCRWNGAIWCVADCDGQETLIRLDQSLRPSAWYHVPTADKVHSIIPYRDGVLVTDTAHNRLVLLTLDDARVHLHEEVIWRAPGVADDRDHVHLNSVTCLDGTLYVTLLGLRPDGITKGWQEAVNGCVMETGSNRELHVGLNKPHTVIAVDGALYWLESRTGSVWRLDMVGGAEAEVVASFPGRFLRGMAADEHFLYVGVCARRRRSRSSGEMIDWGETSRPLYQSGLLRIDRRTCASELHDLTGYTHEIFDLLLLGPDETIPPPGTLPAHAERLYRLFDQHLDLRDRLAQEQAKSRAMEKQMRARDRKDRELQKQLRAVRKHR